MSKADHLVIKDILKGSQKSMQVLYQRYERQWFRVCLRYGKNRNQAQDILQEGLVLIFRDLSQFKPERGSFQNWSNRIIVNAALRNLKKNQWQQSFADLDAAQLEENLESNILDKITAKELTLLIQQLPTGYRMVFNMYELEGYTHKEVAEALNITIGTSKSQLSKAKKLLRKKLEILF